MLNKLPYLIFMLLPTECYISNPSTNKENAEALAKTIVTQYHLLFAKDDAFVRRGQREMAGETEDTLNFFLLIKRIRHSLENCCI